MKIKDLVKFFIYTACDQNVARILYFFSFSSSKISSIILKSKTLFLRNIQVLLTIESDRNKLLNSFFRVQFEETVTDYCGLLQDGATSHTIRQNIDLLLFLCL